MERAYTNISNKTVARSGALAGIATVFAYSLLVSIYAIVRSSIFIYGIMPNSERSIILLTSGFSIAYSVAVFSFLMALLSAVTGSVTAISIKKGLQYFNPRFKLRKAILISGITAILLIALLYFTLYSLLKPFETFDSFETILFWFYLPAIIFFAVCLIAGREITNETIHEK